MKLQALELIHVAMPLVSPFRTSFGTETVRDALLLRLATDGPDGWGECVAGTEPLYSSEFLVASTAVITKHLWPRLVAYEREHGPVAPAHVAQALAPVKGHPMAKAAVEMAVLDAWLRERGVSLGDYLGAIHSKVPAGVSVGIQNSISELIDVVGGYLAEGYHRIKLKIEPGFDIEPTRAVRERYGDQILLQVDANAAYTLSDAHHLARLDDFNLLLIEQPLAENDLRRHAELAKIIRTPICLDESITSAEAAADAIALGACRVVNIKAGRVGGYLAARAIHDVCNANGLAVWCGGMVETGLGRAANLALAALPGFTLPGDVSASNRFYNRDITEPFVLDDGFQHVPSGPGLGVEPLADALAEVSGTRAVLAVT